MSGITSGIGLFSGIDSASIIQQLLSIEARPRDLAQARIVQLQFQSAAYLDINTRMSALMNAAKAFRDAKTFQTKSATSSNDAVLTATASTSASSGSFQFIVDRMVSTQQSLSRGFANRDAAAVGVTQMTLESTQARIDRDVALSELNSGAGVERGRITITDSDGATAQIDLSRTTTINEVLEAINLNGTASVAASVEGGRLIVRDTAAGAGTMSIANSAGYNTAASLGIAGSAVGGVLTGSNVYGLHESMLLSQLNDGRGVWMKNTIGLDAYSFSIIVEEGGIPTTVRINLGDVYENVVPEGGGPAEQTRTAGAVTTIRGVMDRIDAAIGDAGFSDISLTIDAVSGRLSLIDTTGTRTLTIEENGETTAADLGLSAGPPASSITGRRVLAGLNSTLLRGLNGGDGMAGDGVLNFTLRNGSTFSVTLDDDASLQDIFDQIEAASDSGSGARVQVALDQRGTGFSITDLTGGSGNLIITGTTGSDTAASLGVSTGAAGVASATESSGNLQRQYITRSTRLSSLNAGRGIGNGTLRITDARGNSETLTVTDSLQTVGDFLSFVNSRGLINVTAQINANGDGIEVIEEIPPGGSAGATRIRIQDESGSVAESLNIEGTATGTGAANAINGSYERTVTFSAADTLEEVVEKINDSGAGVNAAIVQDGSTSAPFRMSLTASNSGSAGRFIFDTGAFDFGFQTLEAGRDARIFYGSQDAARGVAVSASSNTIDTILPGVQIDLRSASATPVTLNVQTDTAAIEEAVGAFVEAFNAVAARIDFQSAYNEETERGGPLLGDGTVRELRGQLFNVLNAPGIGTTGRFRRLTEVGISVGEDGTAVLNTERLREALNEDPGSVESLFVTRVVEDDTELDPNGDGSVIVRNPNAGSTFSALGVMGQFEQLATRYTDSLNGVLTGRTRGIDEQIALQNSRIAAYNVRLEQKQAALQRQFLAMEQAIGRMQTQQSALSSIQIG